MEVNILITSVSRKVWLVNAFKSALKKSGIEGKVVGVDCDPMAPALYKCDSHYIVPKTSESNFMESLLDICQKENIKLIIPTRDGELLTFAENKTIFEKNSIMVMVSDPKVIEICRDKYKFYKFVKDHNIPTPETFLPKEIEKVDNIKFPVIIKPRGGSGGRNIFKVNTNDELKFLIRYVEDAIVQEFVNGKEYTIDLLSDFNGKIVSAVPRERIEVVAGESVKSKTVKDEEIIRYACEVARLFHTIGHITIQCIKNSEIKITEVNPRFGGAAATSFAAGADSPYFLVQMILGKPINSILGKFKEGLIMLRYSEDIYMEESELDKGSNF